MCHVVCHVSEYPMMCHNVASVMQCHKCRKVSHNVTRATVLVPCYRSAYVEVYWAVVHSTKSLKINVSKNINL